MCGWVVRSGVCVVGQLVQLAMELLMTQAVVLVKGFTLAPSHTITHHTQLPSAAVGLCGQSLHTLPPSPSTHCPSPSPPTHCPSPSPPITITVIIYSPHCRDKLRPSITHHHQLRTFPFSSLLLLATCHLPHLSKPHPQITDRSSQDRRQLHHDLHDL